MGGLNGNVPTQFENLESLKVLLLDADDSPSVYQLGSGSYILSDCEGTSSLISCTSECCLCCPSDTFGIGCSSPQMANLAIDWDVLYGRRAGETIDFGVNTEDFKPDLVQA